MFERFVANVTTHIYVHPKMGVLKTTLIINYYFAQQQVGRGDVQTGGSVAYTLSGLAYVSPRGHLEPPLRRGLRV
jgi:hypothetical protein